MIAGKSYFTKPDRLVEPPRDGEFFFELDELRRERRVSSLFHRTILRTRRFVRKSPVFSLSLGVIMGVLLSSMFLDFSLLTR